MKRTTLVTFFLLFASSILAAESVRPTTREAKITAVTTYLDRTAVWVGDPLRYTIHVVHDPSIEFALDNLTKGNVALAPFVLREVTIDRRLWGSHQKLLEVVLILTTYETGKSELQIPSFNLYYFIREPGSRLGREAAAEVAVVPATKIGLRSTLTGDQARPRDVRPAVNPGRTRALLTLSLGLAGVIVLALDAARRVWLALKRKRSARRRVSRQVREKLAREGLERIRAIAGDSAADIVQFCGEVSEFLRHYVTQSFEIGAAALTPEEIETAIERAGANGAIGREIRTILDECDAVRYDRHRPHLDREWHARLMERVERAVRA